MAENEDWRRLLELAQRHKVTARLGASLLPQESVKLPSDTRQALADAARQNLLASVDSRAQLLRIITILDAGNIRPVLLKGLAAEAWYRRPGLRQVGDIDLIVDPAHAAPALKLLTDAGYSVRAGDPWYRFDHGATLIGTRFRKRYKEIQIERDGKLLELHWRFTTTSTLLPLGFEQELDGLRRLPLHREQGIDVLAPMAAFAYISVHGAMHQWARLHWLLDIPPALGELSQPQCHALLNWGRRHGLLDTLLLGPTMLQLLFGYESPDDFNQAAARSHNLPAMRDYCLGMLTAPGVAWSDGRHNRFKQLLFGLSLCRRVDYRLDYLCRRTWRR